MKSSLLNLKELDLRNKLGIALTLYELGAFITRKYPTITGICHRYPPVGVFVASLTVWHLVFEGKYDVVLNRRGVSETPTGDAEHSVFDSGYRGHIKSSLQSDMGDIY